MLIASSRLHALGLLGQARDIRWYSSTARRCPTIFALQLCWPTFRVQVTLRPKTWAPRRHDVSRGVKRTKAAKKPRRTCSTTTSLKATNGGRPLESLTDHRPIRGARLDASSSWHSHESNMALRHQGEQNCTRRMIHTIVKEAKERKTVHVSSKKQNLSCIIAFSLLASICQPSLLLIWLIMLPLPLMTMPRRLPPVHSLHQISPSCSFKRFDRG